MDIMDAIKKRRSIRKFLELPVEWDKVISILEAGRYAPTAGNLQAWKFIIINDQGAKDKVAEACLQQLWIAAAPMMIAIVSNPEKHEQHYGKAGEKYVVQDCAMAAENMMLAAAAQGLASCFVAAFDERMMSSALGIPERGRPEGIVVIGYPDEEVPVPPKTVLESLVFLQKYANRIKDINMVMWDVSLMFEERLKKAKETAQKKVGKVQKQIEKYVQEKKMRQQGEKEYREDIARMEEKLYEQEEPLGIKIGKKFGEKARKIKEKLKKKKG